MLTTGQALLTGLARRIADIESTGSRFSPFKYLRYNETALCTMIADLLDPRGSHGQRGLFLREFLQLLKIEATNAETDAATVTPEYWTDLGHRIDIFIDLASTLIAIEAKPYSKERDDQMFDYAAYLKRRSCVSRYLVFVSPGGDEPKSLGKHALDFKLGRQLKCVRFTSAVGDQARSIQSWLDLLIENKCLPLNLHWWISELSRFFQMGFSGESKMSDEIVTYVLRLPEEQQRAAFVLLEASDTIKTCTIERFFNSVESRVSEKWSDKFQIATRNDPGKQRIISWRHPNWPGRTEVCFELYDGSRFNFGLSGPNLSEESREGVARVLGPVLKEFGRPCSSGPDWGVWIKDVKPLDGQFDTARLADLVGRSGEVARDQAVNCIFAILRATESLTLDEARGSSNSSL